MQLKVLSRLIMPQFILFGLPFTLAGAILPFAQPHFHFAGDWTIWIWIVMAFIAARTAGMSLNEWIDRHIDAANPRTMHRVLPSGAASPKQVMVVAALSLMLFLFCCAQTNPTVFAMAPLLSLLIIGYSYTKRVTSLSHFVLGIIQFFGPLMAWLSIAGTWQWAPFCLGAALFMSIAANDIVYAVQDYQFDRSYGLRSIPVLLGPAKSVQLARVLHLLCLLLLVATGWLAQLPGIYYFGILAMASALLYHHYSLDLKQSVSIPQAFFSANAAIAFLTFLSTLGAVLWRVL